MEENNLWQISGLAQDKTVSRLILLKTYGKRFKPSHNCSEVKTVSDSHKTKALFAF